MVTITKVNDSIKFEFEDSQHYLVGNGEITVPMNSLMLTLDDSNMATFKKIDGDPFISFNIDESNFADKDALLDFYETEMTGAVGSDIDSGAVQTMIDESISGISATSMSAITEVSGWTESSAQGKNIHLKTIKGDGSTGKTIILSSKTDADIVIDTNSQYPQLHINSAFTNSLITNVDYVSSANTINFLNSSGNTVATIDTSDFVIDGMVDDVRIDEISGDTYLVIDFNTASGKQDIQIPLTEIFDPSNYYDKNDIDGIVSGLNQSIDAKLDASAYTPTDLSEYWTSAQTESAINSAVSGKQDTLIAGSGIEIDAENNIKAVFKYINADSICDCVDEECSTEDLEVFGDTYLELIINNETGLTRTVSISLYDDEEGEDVYKIIANPDFYNGDFGIDETESSENWSDYVTITYEPNYFIIRRNPNSPIDVEDIYINKIEASNICITSFKEITEDTNIALLSLKETKQNRLTAGDGIDISDDTISVSGKVNTSAITSSVTSASTDTEIPTAKAVFDAIPTGGGKAISAGTNISVTTGETADTINCKIPYFDVTYARTDIILGKDMPSVSDYNRVFYGKKIASRANEYLGYSIGIGVPPSNNSLDYNELYGSYSIGIGGFKIGNGNQYSNLVNGCVAIGYGAKTRIDNAVAIGKDTEASGTTKTNINNQLTIDTSNQVYIYNKDNTEMICLQDNLGGGVASSAVTSGDTNAVSSDAVYEQLGGLKLQQITQADYDALVSGGTVDSSTLYVITNVVN